MKMEVKREEGTWMVERRRFKEGALVSIVCGIFGFDLT